MAVYDGSASASAGSPQHSTLLSSYGANRPAWEVAGVDYHVGAPEGSSLKNPATISMAGVSVNSGSRTITVTGDNVRLDGYDFSLNGGWGVVVEGANTTIQNSNFAVGSNGRAPILATFDASNLTVSHTNIDGNGSAAVGGLIEFRGAGTLTVKHSWLKDAGGDMIQMHTNGKAATAVIENNLLENAGMASGAHGDYTQFIDGPYNATIRFNTTMQDGGTTQGIMVEPGGRIVAGEIGYNTFTAKGGGINVYTGVTVAEISDQFTVHNNYFDPTGTLVGLSVGGIRGGANDSSSKTVYAQNMNMRTGAVSEDSNAPDMPLPTPSTPAPGPGPGTGPGTGPAPTAPGAPTIASFSNDSGKAGDKITNDSTLTLAGKAVAGSTVNVFDGTSQIGTATANSSGAWSYTTAALSDGSHNLTAKATTSAGTSAASAALAVRIDTAAPKAPTIATPTNNSNGGVNLAGTAEANSTVRVYDGTTQVGTATANGSGAWGYTTAALSAGSHSLTAKATDVAGNTGAASAAVAVNLNGQTPAPNPNPDPGPNPTPNAPGAPKVASFSNDTGVRGDGITSDSTLTLAGTAVANSTVKVFDGSKYIGTTNANSNGNWSYTSDALSDGSHSLTAKATDASGKTSAASSALAVKIDTTDPTAPKIGSIVADGQTIARGTANADDLTLKGTAEANSTVRVFDGTKEIGTAKANASGSWSYAANDLSDGSHSFTAKAIDAAGNTSTASSAVRVNVDTQDDAQAPVANITNGWQTWSDKVVFKGKADPYSHVTIYDNGGGKAIASVKAGEDGQWRAVSSPVSDNVVHKFQAKVTDSSGHTTSSPGSFVLGTDGNDRLTGTSGNDVLKGNGGHDTFMFAPNFGRDTITDFGSGWRGHDVMQFSKNTFANYADVMSHASQSGRDVVIDAGGDNSLTLKNTKVASLDKHDFHFA